MNRLLTRTASAWSLHIDALEREGGREEKAHNHYDAEPKHSQRVSDMTDSDELVWPVYLCGLELDLPFVSE